jgi:hypothetical protein
MPPWNLEETRNHVAHSYGDAQLYVVRKCLESIIDRQRYAAYHFQEYHRLLSEHIDDRLTSKSIYEITLPFEQKQYAEYNLCLTRVSANIVACVQSMHSLGDILAHVVYFALCMNIGQSKLKEQDVSLSTVIRLLKQDQVFVELTTILDGILRHPEFIYLNALVDHSKHRSIIDTVLSVDPPAEGRPPYTLLFEAFTYRDKLYPQREIQPFIEPVYAWLSHEVVICGNALNRILMQ